MKSIAEKPEATMPSPEEWAKLTEDYPEVAKDFRKTQAEQRSLARIRNLNDCLKFAKTHPGGTVVVAGSWPEKQYTSEEYRYWFGECLDRKISSHFAQRGRKHIDRYQEDLEWDGRQIRAYHSRLRQTGCRNLLRTRELKALFPHIDNQPCEC